MGRLAEMTIQALLEREGRKEREVLLNIPVSDLKEPLALYSRILNEVIYLYANELMSKEVEEKGFVAYLPEELAILCRKSKTVGWWEWVDFLRMLHHIKKTFLGAKIIKT